MRLLINIPKEFEQHFKQDAFKDSLHRLSADAHLLAGNYEQEIAVMLIEAFKTAIPVPDHGRLIDSDELKTAFPCGESVRTECVRATIDHMPTIIPADKEGE